MDSPLIPDLALAYLRELSLDFRAGIVVDGGGQRLAGPAELLEPARAVLDVLAAADGLIIPTGAGCVVSVRSHAAGIVVAMGPLALPGLMLHDLTHVVSLLGHAEPGEPSGETTPCSPLALRSRGEAVQRAVAGVATLSSGDR